MDENIRMENEMEEIIAKLESLFEENPEYNMETLKKYLNRTGELTITVNRLKEEIMAENPGISHDELIEKTSEKVAEMVQMQEMENTTEQSSNEDRE